jgi:hypothetical protein|tara:strand:- start:229 stop:390 length:162 start_codon:yes stop_codon:yes gene_type:complete
MSKVSMTTRLPEEVSHVMDKSRNDRNHRFYDRSNSYIINKVMSDWAKREKKNG